MFMEMGLNMEVGGDHRRFYFDFASGAYNKSDASDVGVVVKRSSLAGAASVLLTVTGGKESGENHGLGANYSGADDGTDVWINTGYETSVRQVSFADGEESKIVTLTVVDNPTLELDRPLTLTLSAPSVGSVTGGSRTLTIVEDSADTAYIYNAVTDFASWGGSVGLVADSESDAIANQGVLMDLIAYIKAIEGWDAATNQAIIYIPDGTYYIDYAVNLWPGIRIVGESRDGVVIQRPGLAFYVAQGYVVDGDPISPWFTCFMLRATGDAEYIWNGASDSKPLGFQNLTMDGAYDDFAAIYDVYTEFEHSHFMKANIANHVSDFGVATIVIDNCTFQNNLTTNFTCGDNTLSYVYHVTNTGGVEGKGDYGFNGGNTTAKVADVTGSRQIEFEQNGATSGHYSDSRLDIDFVNVTGEYLQLGLAVDPAIGPQLIDFTDCTINNLNIIAADATVTFTDCTHNLTLYGSGDDTYLQACNSCIFTNCTFNMELGEGSTSSGIPFTYDTYLTGTTWTFDNCTFVKTGTWATDAHVFDNTDQTLTPTGCTLNLTDCTFNGFDWVVKTENGGTVNVVRPTLVNCGGFMNMHGNATNPFELSVTGPLTITGGLDNYLLTRLPNTLVTTNKITHVMDEATPTVILTSDQCLVWSGSLSSGGNGIRDITYAGHRRITGATVSDQITGLPGDEFYDTDTSAVTHTVTVEGDGNESQMGFKRVQDGNVNPTTWTGV